MGCINTITANRFPRQRDVGCRVEVCFHYDTRQTQFGTIVRDDIEEPYLTIIQLDSGRFVLATECQYSPRQTTE